MYHDVEITYLAKVCFAIEMQSCNLSCASKKEHDASVLPVNTICGLFLITKLPRNLTQLYHYPYEALFMPALF